ncbi:MAG TPA: type II toxin-antitoxin system HicB family antitoxin [Gemmataceae bacterium]|jgi:predicted HicB family RNase H-like nuclease|nr:type II toxin-antitoxin system HicB family antitoxin [Gemmataceae bacterium]
MMEYKGYVGHVAFDNDAGIFQGEVVDTRDVITFQGRTVEEVRAAFRDSVNDYLAFCAERGEAPDKPFSGHFVTRISPALHRRVNTVAALAGMSLNAWVAGQLEKGVQTVLPEKAKPARTQAAGRRPGSKIVTARGTRKQSSKAHRQGV